MSGLQTLGDYTPLPAYTDGEGHDDTIQPSRNRLATFVDSNVGLVIPRSLLWTSFLLVIICTFNVILLPVTLYKYDVLPQSKEDLENLPYPSRLLGMERAAKKLAAPKEWVRSWPSAIARINENLKTTEYEADNQVLVSVEGSTLMHFRVPKSQSNSFSCAISWTGPTPHSSRAEDFEMKGDVSELEVWSVGSSSPSFQDIDFPALTWTNRPVRKELLGTLDLKATQQAITDEFPCSGKKEDLVVELRCLRVACHLKFKQQGGSFKTGFELIRKD